MGADGINVETKWAYMDFASPLGIPLRWRAGLQPWYLPKGIIIDDDVAGFRAYGKYSMLSYDSGWYRASSGQPGTRDHDDRLYQRRLYHHGGRDHGDPESSNNVTDNNLDYYQGGATLNIAKWLNPGLYYIYGRNAASANPAVASQQFLGFDRHRRPGVLEV